MEIENRKRLEELVAKLREFINSPIHVTYVGDTKRTLETVEEGILDTEITSIDSLFYMLELRGQRKVLKSNISLFEDTVDNLKARILAIQDEEQEIPHNTNEEDNEVL